MKERFLEVIYVCNMIIIRLIAAIFSILLTPFYPFMYVIIGKNIYKEISKTEEKILEKITSLIEY